VGRITLRQDAVSSRGQKSVNLSKTVNPTGSYTINLPANVCEDKDDRVMSYWLQGHDVLLQLSSYARVEGEQVSADDRLKARLSKENLSDVRFEDISIHSCPDCAAISGVDDKGCRWFFCYAVWPDLTILATISGPANELSEHGKWTFDGLKSIRRT
jgi:hypothetical protein